MTAAWSSILLLPLVGCGRLSPLPATVDTATTGRPDPAGGDSADSSGPLGRPRSRFASGSTVLELLPPASSDAAAPAAELHFVIALPERASDAAFAIAAATSLRRAVSDERLHREHCPDQTTGCSAAEFEKTPAAAEVVFLRERLVVSSGNAVQARDACAPEAQRVLSSIKAWSDAGEGVVVSIYAPDSFPQGPDPLDAADVHAFAVVGASVAGLTLVDPVDLAPVFYQLSAGKLCDALLSPPIASWDVPVTPTRGWVVDAWHARASAAPSPQPQPPPDDVQATAPEPPVSPCSRAASVCDLGTVTVGDEASDRMHNRSFGLPDSRQAQLRWGVSKPAASSSRRWLQDLESRWAVKGTGNGFTMMVPPGESATSSLVAAYETAGTREGSLLLPLARRFSEFARASGKDRGISARAIIRFVQELPYANIGGSEDPMDLRPPALVLDAGAGDCDSKSLLASVLLRQLGLDAGVAWSSSYQHAMLAVAGGDGFSGGGLLRGGKSWVIVEMTSIREPGEGSHVGFSSRPVAISGDWELAVTQ